MQLISTNSAVSGDIHRQNLFILQSCYNKPANIGALNSATGTIFSGSETMVVQAPTALLTQANVIQDLPNNQLLVVIQGVSLDPSNPVWKYAQIPNIIASYLAVFNGASTIAAFSNN